MGQPRHDGRRAPLASFDMPSMALETQAKAVKAAEHALMLTRKLRGEHHAETAEALWAKSEEMVGERF